MLRGILVAYLVFLATDLTGVLNYLYLSIPTIIALVFARREGQTRRHAELPAYTVGMFIALVVGLTEDVFPDVPVLALCVFMVINVLSLALLKEQAYGDTLTGLDNGRGLERHLAAMLPHASPEHPVGIFLVDLVGTGAINDSFGYLRGDETLRKLSHALSSLAMELDAYVARRRDDEFCLVVNLAGHTPTGIESQINETLRNTGAGLHADACSIAVHVEHTACTTPMSGSDALARMAGEQGADKAATSLQPRSMSPLA